VSDRHQVGCKFKRSEMLLHYWLHDNQSSIQKVGQTHRRLCSDILVVIPLFYKYYRYRDLLCDFNTWSTSRRACGLVP